MLREINQVVRVCVPAVSCSVGAWSGPEDNYGFTDDVVARDKAPEPAVGGVIPIVTHREVLSFGHDQFITLNMVEQLAGAVINRDVGLVLREVVQVLGRLHRLQLPIRLLDSFAVKNEHLVFKPDVVARDSDDPLYIRLCRIDGILENDDVSPVDVLIRQKVA